MGSRLNPLVSKPGGSLGRIIFRDDPSPNQKSDIPGEKLFHPITRWLEPGFFAFGFQAHEVSHQVVDFGVLDCASPRRHVKWGRRAVRVE